MSRTMHVDLTPSRRSKRLIQNGYYQPSPGEQLQMESSEEEDDNTSVHSSTSSVYSERAIHYNEGYTPGGHRRRRRKAFDSPRSSSTAGHTLSPILKNSTPRQKVTKQMLPPDLSARHFSQRSTTFSRQEASTSGIKQAKTTIMSVKNVSQRFARGESRSLTQLSQRSHVQMAGQGDRVGINDMGDQQSVTKRRMAQVTEESHLDTVVTSSKESGESTSYQETVDHVNENSHTATEVSHTTSRDYRDTARVQYSSTESDLEDIRGSTVATEDQYEAEALISFLFSKVSGIVLRITALVVSCFAYICQSIYQVTLAIFVSDVWWLSLRTSPLFVRVVRAMLFILLVLLLLATSNFIVGQFYEEEASALLLPVQSIGGAFHMLSQKIRSFSVQPSPEEETLMQMETMAKIDKTQAAYPATYPELEEALSRMELQFADKLVQMKKVIDAVRKQQFDYNKRQMEDFRSALVDLEHRLQKEILKQISVSDDRTAEKLIAIKAEIASIRTNRTKSGDDVKAEIEQLRNLLSERSHATTKITEYNTKLAAFDARLTTLNNLMIKSMKDFDKHVGNTTYLKEIAKMQFIESFLHLMRTDPNKKPPEGQNNLNFLFIAWLKQQGFAHVEEIDRSVVDALAKTNVTLEALDEKFTQHIEKLRKTVTRQASSVTLDHIMDRPLKSTSLSDSEMENQVKQWIQTELETYSADRIALADHALESAGGFIVSTRCSESYNRKTALVSLLGIPIYYNINTPRSVIQPSTLPGECWSFKGSEGYLVIFLSGTILPTSFTLEHIPRELSPYGRIDSAPKDFVVLGLHDSYDYEGVPLGEFRYEEDGPVIQQFAALAQPEYFTHIELRIRSNWGHKEYTCLYRFRVHGTRQEEGVPVV